MKDIYVMNKVSKIYHNLSEDMVALDKIDLKIIEGEVLVILGPSGSGKSTMLNVLSGIDNPSEGEIYFNEKRIDKFDEKELSDYRKDNLGFIFQNYNIISNLTVRENIELGAHLSSNELDIDEVIDAVGLDNHKYKYPYQLSGGQMQRVSIARAIVKNPKVLFCDEPTGALDEETGKNILKILQEINEKYKTTMVIVTHNPSIAKMANTVVKMNSGEIVSLKHNEKVLSADELGWA